MNFRSDTIGRYIAQRIRELSQVEKPPRPGLTLKQKRATSVRAGVQGGTARKAMAAIKKLFGR